MRRLAIAIVLGAVLAFSCRVMAEDQPQARISPESVAQAKQILSEVSALGYQTQVGISEMEYKRLALPLYSKAMAFSDECPDQAVASMIRFRAHQVDSIRLSFQFRVLTGELSADDLQVWGQTLIDAAKKSRQELDSLLAKQ
jgi:hypothetical protein